MRVGINSLLLAPGGMGGVEVYLRNLLTAVADADPLNQYLVIQNSDLGDALDLAYPNFDKYIVSVPTPGQLFPLRIWRKLKRTIVNRIDTTLEEDWLLNKLKRLQIDVIHHPFSYLYPPVSWHVPSVLTFWDIQHEFYPQFFTDYELTERQRLYRPSLAAATKIIVPSEFTRQTLIDYYHIDRLKTELIYFGVDPGFPDVVEPARVNRLRQKYGLSESIIYYPAATYAHKNHIRLIEAFIEVAQRRPDVQLVLTGAAMSAETQVNQTIEATGISHRIKRLGFVPRSEIPDFYAAAKLLIFPSLFEGYGIPVLEAMHLGCPVACANVCSLPELAGEAALTFDPKVVPAIAEAMMRLLTDDDTAEQLAILGRRQSHRCSWQTAAKLTIKVYQHAAKSVPG